jgi:hypothetical protein
MYFDQTAAEGDANTSPVFAEWPEAGEDAAFKAVTLPERGFFSAIPVFCCEIFIAKPHVFRMP